MAGARVRPRRVVIIGCERRLFVNTRSKNWAMTVRQIGWLKVHLSLGQKTEHDRLFRLGCGALVAMGRPPARPQPHPLMGLPWR